MQFQRSLAVLTMVFSGLGIAGSQVIGSFEKDGKTVTCIHSGLMSDLTIVASDLIGTHTFLWVQFPASLRLKATKREFKLYRKKSSTEGLPLP